MINHLSKLKFEFVDQINGYYITTYLPARRPMCMLSSLHESNVARWVDDYILSIIHCESLLIEPPLLHITPDSHEILACEHNLLLTCKYTYLIIESPEVGMQYQSALHFLASNAHPNDLKTRNFCHNNGNYNIFQRLFILSCCLILPKGAIFNNRNHKKSHSNYWFCLLGK